MYLGLLVTKLSQINNLIDMNTNCTYYVKENKRKSKVSLKPGKLGHTTKTKIEEKKMRARKKLSSDQFLVLGKLPLGKFTPHPRKSPLENCPLEVPTIRKIPRVCIT